MLSWPGAPCGRLAGGHLASCATTCDSGEQRPRTRKRPPRCATSPMAAAPRQLARRRAHLAGSVRTHPGVSPSRARYAPLRRVLAADLATAMAVLTGRVTIPAALTRRQLLDLAATHLSTRSLPRRMSNRVLTQPGRGTNGTATSTVVCAPPTTPTLPVLMSLRFLLLSTSTVVVVCAPIVNRSDRRFPGPRWRLAELEIGLLLVSNQHVALPVEYARVPPPVVTAGRTRARGDPGDRR
jgi:hypothetical protein